MRRAAGGLAALVFAMCMRGGSGSAHAAEQIPPAATQEAQQIFNSRCTMCHGAAGKGDGPAAAALKPQPRDLSDPAWQKSVTDQQIEQIIVGGGPAVGKSPLMPANADLRTKPDVVRALVVLVRNLGRTS